MTLVGSQDTLNIFHKLIVKSPRSLKSRNLRPESFSNSVS